MEAVWQIIQTDLVKLQIIIQSIIEKEVGSTNKSAD
jgi:uncharacterized protein with HEPN domain